MLWRWLLVLCALVACASAQLSVNTSLMYSGITGFACFGQDNLYQLTMSNGFPVPVESSVILTCNGFSPVTYSVPLAAFEGEQQVNIQAVPPVFVSNNLCQITVYFPDPTSSTGQLVPVAGMDPNWCGNAPGTYPDGYTLGCSWVDYFCQVSNGEWYHYGPFLATVLLFFMVIDIFVEVLVAYLGRSIIYKRVGFVETKYLMSQTSSVPRTAQQRFPQASFGAPSTPAMSLSSISPAPMPTVYGAYQESSFAPDIPVRLE